ncbi:MAG TPA: hypothetical protein VGV92_09620 [Gammaproteobacteria bacterium]|nr:hypothetical protein [Gammaproteobacteria bacterium]
MEEAPAAVIARHRKALVANQYNTLAFVNTVLDLTDYILNNKARIKSDTIQSSLFLFCYDIFDKSWRTKGGKLYSLSHNPNYGEIKERAMRLLRDVYEDKNLLNVLSKENQALAKKLISEEDEIKRQQKVEQEEQEKAKRSRSNSSPDGAQRNPGSLTDFFDAKKQKSDSPPIAAPEPEKKADSKPESNPEPHAYQSVPLSLAFSLQGSSSRSSSGTGAKK